MIYGLTFNNQHSSLFSTYIRTKDRVLFPTLRKREVQVPGRHGTYDFGDNTFESKLIAIKFTVTASSLHDLRIKARLIAAWLNTTSRQKLVFDDEPDKYYMARVFEKVSIEDIVTTGIFQTTFECEPFAYGAASTSEDVTWDSDIVWDSDVTWGGSDNYTFSVTQSPTELQVDNAGTMPTRPVIIVTGSFTTISIAVNGKVLTYTEAVADGTIIINNDKYTVKKDTTNKLAVVTGDTEYFLELTAGVNTVTITGTDLNCLVLFEFRPLYL
jgi:predicted phage tail component-like protein